MARNGGNVTYVPRQQPPGPNMWQVIGEQMQQLPGQMLQMMMQQQQMKQQKEAMKLQQQKLKLDQAEFDNKMKATQQGQEAALSQLMQVAQDPTLMETMHGSQQSQIQQLGQQYSMQGADFGGLGNANVPTAESMTASGVKAIEGREAAKAAAPGMLEEIDVDARRKSAMQIQALRKLLPTADVEQKAAISHAIELAKAGLGTQADDILLRLAPDAASKVRLEQDRLELRQAKSEADADARARKVLADRLRIDPEMIPEKGAAKALRENLERKDAVGDQVMLMQMSQEGQKEVIRYRAALDKLGSDEAAMTDMLTKRYSTHIDRNYGSQEQPHYLKPHEALQQAITEVNGIYGQNPEFAQVRDRILNRNAEAFQLIGEMAGKFGGITYNTPAEGQEARRAIIAYLKKKGYKMDVIMMVANNTPIKYNAKIPQTQDPRVPPQQRKRRAHDK